MEEHKNDGGRGRGLVRIGEYAKGVFEKLEKRIDFPMRSSQIGGLSYGFDTLDWLTCGMQPEDFIVIAGRSSKGKTDFLVSVIHNVVGPKSKIAVAFFSMKLSASQIHAQLVCSQGKVRRDNFSMGTIEDLEWPKLTWAAGNIYHTPLFIDDSPTLSLEDVRQKLTVLQSERAIGLVVIDSLQLLSDVRDENNAGQVARLSRSIKLLARELRVPILASVHVSRSAQSRFDKRPVIEDLEAWESVAEYADVVGFLHPEEMCTEATDEDQCFIPESEDLDAWEEMTGHVDVMGLFHLRKMYHDVEDEGRIFECIIRKNIKGSLGKASLLYEPVFHRFIEVRITDATKMKH